MKLKLLSLGILLHSLSAFSYMNVDPVIFDKRIDNGGATQEYHITNVTNSPIGYRVYTEKIPEAKNDMTSWIEYYPRELKLSPGETGKIKVLIEAPDKVKKGEYISTLGIKEVNIPTSEKKNSTVQIYTKGETGKIKVLIEAPDKVKKGEYISTLGIKEVNIPTSEKKNSTVQIYTNLKMEIAGFVGDLKPEIELKNLSLNENKLKLELKNIGKIRTKVEVYLSDLKGENKVFVDSIRLLQDKEKEISKTIELKGLKNNKIKILVLDMQGNKILEKRL